MNGFIQPKNRYVVFFKNIYNFLLEKSFTIRSELIPMKLGTQKINHN